MDAITYLCWDKNQSMLVKGTICGSCWLSIYWEQRRKMSIEPKIGWDTYMYMRSENNILKLCLSWRILVSGILIIQDLFSICYTVKLDKDLLQYRFKTTLKQHLTQYYLKNIKLWRSSRSCKPSQSLETCFMIIRTLPTPLNLHVLVAPWCIPLSEPWPLTPVGHMHLFTLYAIIKATSPMSLIASLVASSNLLCMILYLSIAVSFAGNKNTTTTTTTTTLGHMKRRGQWKSDSKYNIFWKTFLTWRETTYGYTPKQKWNVNSHSILT